FGLIHDGVLQSEDLDLTHGLPSGPVFYLLLFSTVLERELVEQALHLSEEDVVEIPRPISILNHPSEQSRPQVHTSKNMEEHKPTELEFLKVRVDILDRLMQLAGELVLVRNQQMLLAEQDGATDRGITQRLDIVTSSLQETIMRTRMQPIGNVFSRFNRLVRDLGHKLGKEIKLEMEGCEVEIDKNILDSLVDPLTHLVRNSCDHGIEDPETRRKSGKPRVGTLILRAFHEGGQIHVDIVDDGHGISRTAVREKLLEKGLRTQEELASMADQELVSLIFLPGFSTAKVVSDVSGRGVGMDVVKTGIENLGGVIEVQSVEGQGTSIQLRLPLTLAIIPCMIVESLGQRFAIPQIDLEELVCLYDEDVMDKVECAGPREVFRLRDSLLTLVRLQEILNRSETFTEEIRREITEKWLGVRKQQQEDLRQAREKGLSAGCSLSFAVLKIGTGRFGLILDRIVGTEEIVVKPMHRAVKDLDIYSGATLLGDGSVAMILDVLGIARHAALRADESSQGKTNGIATQVEIRQENRRQLILFRNAQQEQLAVPMEMIKRIEHVEMEKVERIGEREYIVVDQQSTRMIRLSKYLNIQQVEDQKEMYMLLPKKSRYPYGLLISQLLDIGEYVCHVDRDSYHGPGVTGSTLIQDHMTLMVDPDAVADLAEPEWQKEARHG
ncbi:MAG TPA: chemotaxis protein CheA, partial [Fibrobacteraceae bacterium]|nr:chemotaxis protein CheA [Fibrobacteraceae bacterium]